ncbi:MFS transporter [Micromonospora sp. NPDC005172]|uniref:MFS transporter n=1 Tax=Micromonospora sp. NPDC005172 TaxID=3156867 RepID=UPI0033BDAF1F
MKLPRRAVLLVASMTVAHLPVAMRQLLVVLLGHENTGSFAAAGAASAGCGIGLALTAPFVGRLLGRLGHRPVLLGTGVIHLLALVGLAVTTAPVAFVALATLAGLSTPPVLGSGRSHLARMVPAPALSRAYAVNAVGQELLYVGGPLAVTVILLLSGPAGALLTFATIGSAGLVGTALVVPRHSAHTPVATDRPVTSGRATRRTVLGTQVAYMAAIGSMWVLVPAFATAVGHPGQAGLLVTLWSVGSLAGGLLLARRGRPGTPGGAYLTLVGTLAVTSLALALPRTVPQMAAALAVFGLALAPFLAVTDELLARSTPTPQLAEAYGWLQTAGQVGLAVGSATAGAITDHVGSTPGFLAASAALVLATAVAFTRRRSLRLPNAAPQVARVAEPAATAPRGFAGDDAG